MTREETKTEGTDDKKASNTNYESLLLPRQHLLSTCRESTSTAALQRAAMSGLAAVICELGVIQTDYSVKFTGYEAGVTCHLLRRRGDH